MIDTYF